MVYERAASQLPTLYVCPVENVLGRVPLIPWQQRRLMQQPDGRLNKPSNIAYDVVCDVVYDIAYDIVYFPDIISRLCNGGGGRLWTGYA